MLFSHIIVFKYEKGWFNKLPSTNLHCGDRIAEMIKDYYAQWLNPGSDVNITTCNEALAKQDINNIYEIILITRSNSRNVNNNYALLILFLND